MTEKMVQSVKKSANSRKKEVCKYVKSKKEERFRFIAWRDVALIRSRLFINVFKV
jgi:hypothetical protein